MTILTVSDEQQLCGEVGAMLERAGFTEHATTDSEASALDAIKRLGPETVKAVLIDDRLPGESCLTLCAKIRANRKYANIPILLLMEPGNQMSLENALMVGVTDFVIKPLRPVILATRLHSCLRVVQEVERRTERETQLSTLKGDQHAEEEKPVVEVDRITGFIKAATFLQILKQLPARPDEKFCVYVFHFRGLKNLVETYDKVVAQKIRRQIAEALRGMTVRAGDLVCAYSPAHFVVLSRLSEPVNPMVFARKYRDVIGSANTGIDGRSLKELLRIDVSAAIADKRAVFPAALRGLAEAARSETGIVCSMSSQEE